MLREIEKLADAIKKYNNIVFFGGAGVSTESKIPDFRGTEGIYNQKYDYPPEVILSHEFFIKRTGYFYKFYRDKMLFPNAKPNFAHEFLTELEKVGKLKGIVTQNIDNLHQMAGSKNVMELHGSVYRNYCMDCGKFYGIDEILNSDGIPRCSCGGIIKPDVVLYGEGLDADCMREAIWLISHAQLLIVGGTSLNVYPAAGFLNYFKGNELCIINRENTTYTCRAEISINENIGEAFKKVSKLL